MEIEERQLAEEDARFEGVGFLVDGKRVHPSRVVVLRSKDNDSDLAIAIGEHAFRAGFHEAVDMGAKPDDEAEAVENAWCCYTPPEDLCGKAF